MGNTKYQNLLLKEARAFNHQIIDRVRNGHIPDLQATQRCEWFNNNVWRDPVYANLLFGRIVKQILDAANKTFHGRRIKILEVACGPGHVSLELARAGHSVIGVDISDACINVAIETAKKDVYLSQRGELDFKVLNIFELNDIDTYDMVVFSCALHHFGDQDLIIGKVKSLLKTGGLIFVSEPTKIPLSDSEAELIFMIRSLLSFTGHYHVKGEYDQDYRSIESRIRGIKNEYSFVDAGGEKIQSPLDNEACRDEMMSALTRHFEGIEEGDDFTFFDRIIGGLRMDDVAEEHHLARWIRLLDDYLLDKKHTQAQQFYFIGKKSF